MRISPSTHSFYWLICITLVLNLHALALQKHVDCSLKAMLLMKKSLKNKSLMVIVDRNVLAHRYI